MFNLSLRLVARVLLIAAILFNALTSNPISAQAEQEIASPASNSSQAIDQKKSSVPIFEQPESRVDENTSDNMTFQKSSDLSNANTNNSPITFIENVGQFDPKVRFQAAAEGATIYYTDHDIWFVLLGPRTIGEDKEPHGNQRRGPSLKADTPRKGVNLKLDFVGAKSKNQIEGIREVETTISYFAGSGQEAQYANVPAWNQIRYTDIYPGMDLEVSAEGNDLSWNFVMTDPGLFFEKYGKNNKQEIRIRISGQKK
jgi:hypothetical protein